MLLPVLGVELLADELDCLLEYIVTYDLCDFHQKLRAGTRDGPLDIIE